MIIGLTGGIASGKSTVSNELKKLGAVIIDADKIAKEISNSKEVLEELKKEFGKKVIKEGFLNREELKKIIFKDSKAREKVNNIMHPVIINNMKKKIELNKKKDMIILDIPLLFETKLEYLCEKTLVVWVDEEKQIERIIKRDNLTKELAKKIIDSQMKLSEKLKKSDYDISNNGSLIELLDKVNRFYEKIKQ